METFLGAYPYVVRKITALGVRTRKHTPRRTRPIRDRHGAGQSQAASKRIDIPDAETKLAPRAVMLAATRPASEAIPTI